MTQADLLKSDDVFASTLLVVAVDSFGPALLGNEDTPPWTAQTLRSQFEDTFRIKLSDDNLGKLMAALSILTSDSLFRSLPSFLFVVHGLIGDGTDWSHAEPVEVEDLAWAVTEAMMIWPPDGDSLFDAEIVAYCRTMLKREGILSPPSPLVFAREDAVYGDIGEFGEDILREQSHRTNEINESLEAKQGELLSQLESLKKLGLSSSTLSAAIQGELEEIANRGKWS